jgi:hypothetical protein
MSRNENRKSYGWIWVWATLVVFVALEIARLA